MKSVYYCRHTFQLTSLLLCFSLKRKDDGACEVLYDFKPVFNILL